MTIKEFEQEFGEYALSLVMEALERSKPIEKFSTEEFVDSRGMPYIMNVLERAEPATGGAVYEQHWSEDPDEYSSEPQYVEYIQV